MKENKYDKAYFKLNKNNIILNALINVRLKYVMMMLMLFMYRHS